MAPELLRSPLKMKPASRLHRLLNFMFALVCGLVPLSRTTAALIDPLDQWQWRNPIPTDSPLFGVTYGAGLFVAVGNSGTIITSTNSVTWFDATSNTASDLRNVTWANGSFIAVGNSGTILSSTDGLNWFTQTSGTAAYLWDVAYGNGTFAAVGQSGTILTSTDGATWIPRNSGTSDFIDCITYGNGTFVATLDSWSETALVSKDGVTWNSVPLYNLGQPYAINGITNANGLFVAVGSSGVILTSSDALSWTLQSSGTLANLTSVSYSGGFIVVGGSGAILRSSDAATWKSQSSATSSDLWAVASNNGLSVAVGNSYPGSIVTSTDGFTWQSITRAITSVDMNSIIYANGRFVAVGDGVLLTSTDSTAWSPIFGLGYLWGVSYVNGHFLAVGASGGLFDPNPYPVTATSADGLNWTSDTAESSDFPNTVAYGNGSYVGVGQNGSILSSTDGSNWTPATAGPLTNLTDIVYADGMFVTTGTSIFTSSDGIIWTNRTSNSSVDLQGVTYGGDTFVAVGSAILSSTDGINWVQRQSGLSSPKSLRAVTYGNGEFLAVGDGVNGPVQSDGVVVLSSADGINWHKHFTGTGRNLNGVAFGNGRFVTVGDGGSILQSGTLTPGVSVTAENMPNFGAVEEGGTATLSFIVTNCGNSPVAGMATINNPFLITEGASYLLAPGQSQTIIVSFCPLNSGTFSSQLVVPTPYGNVTWQITGKGVADPTGTTGAVTGIINVVGSNTPLDGVAITAISPGANLFNGGSSPGTVSAGGGAQAGSYEISGLAPNANYELLIDPPPGSKYYAQDIPNVSVVAGGTTTVNITLASIPPITQPTTLPSRETPVVLVRGLAFGGEGTWVAGSGSEYGYWSSFRNSLSSQFNYIWDCNEPDINIDSIRDSKGNVINGQMGIEYNAEQLRAYLNAKAIEYKTETGYFPPEINIIAHSMGGLITRRALEGSDHFTVTDPATGNRFPVKVANIIMLATPNAGTVAANFGVGGNVIPLLFGLPLNDLTTSYIRDEFNPSNPLAPSINVFLSGGNGGANSVVLSGANELGAGLSALSLLMDEIDIALPSEQANDGVVSIPSVSGMYYYRTLPFLGLSSSPSIFSSGVEYDSAQDHLSILNDSNTISWATSILNDSVDSHLVSAKRPSLSTTRNMALVTATGNSTPFQLLTENNALLSSGTVQNMFFLSDATNVLQVQLLTTGTDVGLELIDPAGKQISATTSQSSIQYSLASTGSGTIMTYQITNPLTGQWKAILDGSNMVEPQAQCTLLALGESSLALSPETTGLVHQGQNAVITCALADFSNNPFIPITNAAITATIHLPDGSTTTLNLADDGLHNDGGPNDGIYAAVFPAISEPGEYTITYEAMAQSVQGQSFQREAFGTLKASAETGSLLGNPTFSTLDTDGDGVADILQASCWVSPTAGGNYILSGQLVNATGTIRIPASCQFYANGTGATTQSLLFDISLINAGASGGQFHIENLQLFEAPSSGVAWLDSYEGVANMQIGPTIAIQPQPQTVDEGGEVFLSTVAQGGTFTRYQWRLNGQPISGATNAVLTITNVTLTQAGTYDVLITNNTGSTTSASATLAVEAAPVISLSGTLAFDAIPLNTSSNRMLTINNIGHEPLHLTGLTFPEGFSGNYSSGTISSGSFQNITVSFSPSATVASTTYGGLIAITSDAAAGVSNVQVSGTALDPAPLAPTNISPINDATVSPASLTLQSSNFADSVDGNTESASEWIVSLASNGATVFDSGIDTGEKMAIGISPYVSFATAYLWKVRYQDNHGKWSDYSTPTGFIIQQKPVSSFVLYRGVYTGLSLSGSSTGLIGRFVINVNGSGSFSAYLTINGHVYRFSGVFQKDGIFVGIIPRTGTTALGVSLTLDTTNGTDLITGTLSDRNDVAVVSLGRDIYNGTTSRAPQAGRYTALLSSTDNGFSVPQGSGYATLTVGPAGGMLMEGKLPDGENFGISGVLIGDAANGQFLVYKTLVYAHVSHKGETGLLVGALAFVKGSGVDELSGSLEWLKPQQTSGAYLSAFDTDINVIGSLYTRPSKTHSVLPGFSEGILELSDTSTSSLSGTATIDSEIVLAGDNFVIQSPNPQKVKLAISLSNGIFNGTFLYPNPIKPVEFGGVLFQDQGDGSGFFLGPNGSGTVRLTPSP